MKRKVVLGEEIRARDEIVAYALPFGLVSPFFLCQFTFSPTDCTIFDHLQWLAAINERPDIDQGKGDA